MNCPECDRLTWPYDEHTLTCKAGHHTRVGTPAPTPEPKRRIPPWYVGLAALQAPALIDLTVRLLS